eukprot:scaffold58769_cov44-Phaeocystis_antarctica.AAC.3
MRTCRYCHGTGNLPKDVTGLGPVDERDLRPRSEVQSPCDLKNPYCVRVAPSVKGESQTCALGACKRHCRGPLVQTAQYGRAADDPGPELDCVGEHTSCSVCVCSSHIKYGSSHQGWRGDGVVDRVDSAIDQSGGRELAAGIHRIPKAGHGRPSAGAADVPGDLVRVRVKGRDRCSARGRARVTGRVRMSPVTEVAPVVVMPVLVRSAKRSAEPRSTD